MTLAVQVVVVVVAAALIVDAGPAAQVRRHPSATVRPDADSASAERTRFDLNSKTVQDPYHEQDVKPNSEEEIVIPVLEQKANEFSSDWPRTGNRQREPYGRDEDSLAVESQNNENSLSESPTEEDDENYDYEDDEDGEDYNGNDEGNEAESIAADKPVFNQEIPHKPGTNRVPDIETYTVHYSVSGERPEIFHDQIDSNNNQDSNKYSLQGSVTHSGTESRPYPHRGSFAGRPQRPPTHIRPAQQPVNALQPSPGAVLMDMLSRFNTEMRNRMTDDLTIYKVLPAVVAIYAVSPWVLYGVAAATASGRTLSWFGERLAAMGHHREEMQIVISG